MGILDNLKKKLSKKEKGTTSVPDVKDGPLPSGLYPPHAPSRSTLTLPAIPLSCWPQCQKCGLTKRVESVRFLSPRSPGKDDDIVVVAMECHGERATLAVSALDLAEMRSSKAKALHFVDQLCEMSYFKKADKIPTLPPTTDERIKNWKQGTQLAEPIMIVEDDAPKAPKALKRKDAPWNF